MGQTISACRILAKEQHATEHDNCVCSPTRYHMQGNWSKFRQGNLCEYLPKFVQTSPQGKVIELWNQQLQTDRTIPNKA
jgi:hypothetical protein